MRFSSFFALICCLPLRAQTPAGSEAGSPIEFGFEQRVRNENWNNITDFNDQKADLRHQLRIRSRAWATIPLNSDLSFTAGVNTESNEKFGIATEYGEVIVETLYLDVKQLLTPKLSLRAGRQNLMKGEGFLLFEGGPDDGSRAFYVNAVDLTYAFGKSSLEFLAISDPSRDQYLPQIRSQHRQVGDWTDRALGLYYTNRARDYRSIEGYYFFKSETHDYRMPANRQFQPDRQVHTAGGRMGYQLSPNWRAAGEIAGQWGDPRPDTRGKAWGGYAYVQKDLARRGRPYLQTGYWLFSHGWDPLFARSAQWSEMFLYSFNAERGLGYWSNLRFYKAEAGALPGKRFKLRATYQYVSACQPVRGNPGTFGQGTERGHQVQLRADVVVNPNWKAHVVYERMLPGDFYSGRSVGDFLRFEFSFQAVARIRRQKPAASAAVEQSAEGLSKGVID